LNVALLTTLLAMSLTNVVDAMFMREGLTRYCETTNDAKFADAPARDKALRAYTCATGDAKQYFEKGFNEYLDTKGISHS